MAQALADAIAAACGLRLDAASLRSVSGGSINAAARMDSDAGPVFLKTNRADGREMFAAEAEGLAELAAAGAVRVPRVYGTGVDEGRAWLLLEYLDLGPADTACRRRLGTALAALHRHTAERHGWHRDNTIGSTPQPNGPDDDWVRFLAEKRLGFQLDLAGRNGYGDSVAADGKALLTRLAGFFTDYTPVPSLLHGDLWGGNFAAAEGEPVIYDPAVYYGDRETDIAMTELFGGFGPDFHAAYEEAWPLDDGYALRRDLYQLYHVLNHLNLFGGAYLSQARALLRGLLAA
jgi:fructosamine-3-kinase